MKSELFLKKKMLELGVLKIQKSKIDQLQLHDELNYEHAVGNTW